MNLTKAIFTAGALSLVSVSGAALAQDAAATAKADGPLIAAGVKVYGPEGNEVGTITALADGVATLDTGTHKVGLPLDRFGMNAKKQTTVAVTRAQLDEMLEKAQAEAAAKLDAQLVAGAPVTDVNGVSLGSIGKVEGDDVTVETEWGAFALKRQNFQPADAGVTAQVLADQVKAALGASADAAAQS
ncbi:hypothetical protein [Croceibacterium aestuarii]|uniref:hypothetical protein n=1 Tax=Croceibacterium aestuarii TaxID=3064139 RepID=UPI00272DE6A0|nr:hypothetical protein [Croceibacterium sp. D39]